jgi:uncharacterized protein (TIGR00159 family)
MDDIRFYFQWQVLLDLLLITILLYSIYRTLRATGAWKIALGLTFTAGIAVFARVLGLQGIEWIFSNFSQIALVALLIIFQPEIRRILERSFSFSHGRRGGIEQQIPEIIDQVLFDLAQNRWGALLVFKGEIPIKQWVTDGVRLEALPSVPLLVSLFDPSSPGHDGAAVFEGNRITRFGVHLPLSQTNKLSSDYGTRHHAALGLAEKTDALVFAVSEERGIVTAFRNGTLQRISNRGDAARLIQEHHEEQEPVAGIRKTKKDVFFSLGEVAFSLLVAILIWTTLIQSRTEIREMFFTVPIEYSKPAKNIVLSGKQAEAKLLLEGPLSILRTVEPSLLRVRVDLSSLKPGKHHISLENAAIDIPNNLRLLEIQPTEFDLVVKQAEELNIPIQPQFIGAVPTGYKLTGMDISPSTIVVADPGNITFLTTTPIYLNGLRENTTVLCKIIVPEQMHSRERKWPDVSVRLTISEDK